MSEWFSVCICVCVSVYVCVRMCPRAVLHVSLHVSTPTVAYEGVCMRKSVFAQACLRMWTCVQMLL